MLPQFVNFTGKRKRATEIGKLLKDSPYDVLVLQEAFLGASRRRILRELQGTYAEMYGPANPVRFTLQTSSGIWILSRLPMKVLEEIDYTECYGFDDCMAHKGALLVEVEWQGEPVQILGTHLQSGGPFSIRQSQFEEMRDLLDRHQRDGVPQLVCGDMNTNKANTTEYKAMLSIMDATDGSLGGGPLQFTADGVKNDCCGGGSRNRKVIDYIFLRNQGRKTTVERRWIPLIESQWSPRHRALSDHQPVALEIRWK